MSTLRIERINRSDCEDLILRVHYAKRWPSITYAFGLFDGDRLLGVVTYGTPLSATLRKGIAGTEQEKNVLELNRLVLHENRKNYASFLVGRSLRLLPKSAIIVSFADTEQGHIGYVYQATNFRYYGLSAKRTDWKIKGQEHLHGQTIADKFRGVKNRAQAIRAEYGDDFYLLPRSRKHRYIYCKDKSIYEKIKYKEKPYPKSNI